MRRDRRGITGNIGGGGKLPTGVGPVGGLLRAPGGGVQERQGALVPSSATPEAMSRHRVSLVTPQREPLVVRLPRGSGSESHVATRALCLYMLRHCVVEAPREGRGRGTCTPTAPLCCPAGGWRVRHTRETGRTQGGGFKRDWGLHSWAARTGRGGGCHRRHRLVAHRGVLVQLRSQ